jgi:hypothetical protein
MMISAENLHNESRLIDTVQKATDWLLTLQRENGSFGLYANDLRSYSKIPALLEATGYLQAANRTADWLKGNYLYPDGDFRGKDRKSELATFAKYRYLYPNGWIVAALQRLGRFDLSVPGLKYILTFQNKTYGGIYSQTSPKHKPIVGRMDLASTCSAGIAMLYCGKFAEAEKSGDFLLELLQSQPDPQNRLFTSFYVKTGIVTEFPDEDASNLVVQTDRTNQAYWFPGFAMGFLSMLFLATGNNQYINAAEQFYQFFCQCKEDRFQSYASGKVAWGCSLLYRLTGDKKYQETSLRIANFIVDTQLPEGTWINKPFYQRLEDQPFTLTVDLTVEMAYWLCQMASEIRKG